jgi:RNA polymerase sigma-70 factor (ECF subfamily)
MNIGLDSELVSSGRNGDTQALSELFERHYPSSIRIARRILGCDEDARDVVQSAYLAAFQHLGTFRGEAQFHTWITKIVKNQCFMHLRRPSRRYICAVLDQDETRDAVMALAQQTPTPEDLAWKSQVDAALAGAAGQLPKSLQEVYTLVSELGLRNSEAAHTLGLTLPAVKARLFRAQHRMRSELTRRLGVHKPHETSTVFKGRRAAAQHQIAA